MLSDNSSALKKNLTVSILFINNHTHLLLQSFYPADLANYHYKKVIIIRNEYSTKMDNGNYCCLENIPNIYLKHRN